MGTGGADGAVLPSDAAVVQRRQNDRTGRCAVVVTATAYATS